RVGALRLGRPPGDALVRAGRVVALVLRRRGGGLSPAPQMSGDRPVAGRTIPRMSAQNPPARPTLDGIEARWVQVWDDQGTYRFDRSRPRAEVYAIDTPPPTVSGELHMGSVYSFTHTDIVARFHRMRG